MSEFSLFLKCTNPQLPNGLSLKRSHDTKENTAGLPALVAAIHMLYYPFHGFGASFSYLLLHIQLNFFEQNGKGTQGYTNQ